MNTVTSRRFVRWHEWYKFQPEVNYKHNNDTGNFYWDKTFKIDFERDLTDSLDRLRDSFV